MTRPLRVVGRLARSLAGASAHLWRRGVSVSRASMMMPLHVLHGSSSPATAASSASARKASWSASTLSFLEQFRQGPDPQSEWNVCLWRVTVPLATLVFFTLLAVLGKFGHALYSLLVCPVWYFCQFVLVAYPFVLVLQFPDLDKRVLRRLWQALAAWSFAISAVEWYLSEPTTRTSWVAGNTLFGITALVAIPMFFSTQRFRPSEANDSHASASAASAFPSSDALDALSSPRQFLMSPKHHNSPDSSSVGLASSPYSFDEDQPSALPRSVVGATVLMRSKSNSRRVEDVPAPSGDRSQARVKHKRSRLVTISALCVAVVWLVMFVSYSSKRTGGSAAAVAYWLVLYVLSPALCFGLLVLTTRPTASPSAGDCMDHVMVYGLLIVHLPVFLGHLCIRLFAMAEDSTHDSTTTAWMKLTVSVLYLLVMQCYFVVMTQVVNRVAEPFAHPSLLYIGQLYYYLFWYMLVGSDAPIDLLYWAMLLVNNVHIAFLNTGVYSDVKESSANCWTLPMNLNAGSSVAVCFRVSAAYDRLEADAAASVLSPSSWQGSSRGGFTTDEEDDGPGLFIDDDSVSAEPRINPLKDIVLSPRNASSKGGSSSAVRGSSTCSLSRVNLPCSDSRSKRKRDRMTTLSPPGSTNGGLNASSTADQLRPLYFLMKLAEQDNMADTTALILVPSLLTLLAVFEHPAHGLTILYEQTTMWLRCICMFIGRLGGAYLAREIFAYKLRSRLRKTSPSITRNTSSSSALGSLEGMSTRLWIQRLMLQDFHRQFWYLTVVTIVVTFACFDRADLPFRFALLT